MRSRLLSLGLLACCVLSPVCAVAQGKLDLSSRLSDPLAATTPADPLANARRGQTSLTPADAARRVQSLYGGRVLAVQQDDDGYRVKILKDGEVRIYSVSPQE
ncbi:MAG TPA: hypothetical protein VGE51_15090 [Fontimonas sp.]